MHFMGPDPPKRHFRLGYGSIAAERIPEGVRRLSALALRQRPARRGPASP